MSPIHSQSISTRFTSFFATFTAAVLLFLVCGLASPARAVHEEWNRRWDDPVHLSDIAVKVAVDHGGNVYVAGYSNLDDSGSGAGGNLDYRLIKYSSDGTELWNRRYDGTAHGEDIPAGLALDGQGNVYITGYSQSKGKPHHNIDYVTLKYDPDGNRLWLRRYDDPSHLDDFATALAVDAAGNAYVTGTSGRNAGVPSPSSDYATLKYAPDGQLLWSKRYSGPTESGTYINNKPFGIALDLTGNVYVTGTASYVSATGTSASAAVTLKYSPAGVQLWASFPALSSFDQARAITVDTAGNVYVCGATQSGTGFYNFYYLTLKYDTNGREQWHSLYRGNQFFPAAVALAVDHAGNVLVTGTDGTVKYGPAGKQKWVWDQYYGLGPGSGDAIAVDADDCVYVASKSISKLGPDGSVHWQRTPTGPLPGVQFLLADLALDEDNNVYVTTTTQDSVYSYYDPYKFDNIRTVKYSQQP